MCFNGRDGFEEIGLLAKKFFTALHLCLQARKQLFWLGCLGQQRVKDRTVRRVRQPHLLGNARALVYSRQPCDEDDERRDAVMSAAKVDVDATVCCV